MYQLGFDVGGTNIAVGAVGDDMKIYARRTVRFPTGDPYENTVSMMAGLARDIADELSMRPSEFRSIGIAVPGSIDRARENVVHAYNLQFHNVPLRAALQSHFPNVPVFLSNDANAAALAELWAGAFIGCKTAVLMTLGTGVGGGLIIGGKMFHGGLGNGVEPGHMILIHDGPMCTCGVKGCIESVCTALWLVQQGRRSVVDNPTSVIYTKVHGEMDKVTAKIVIDSAKEGDLIALEIFERYIGYLSSAVASYANMLDPEVIAIGGGVSNAGDFLFKPLIEAVKRKCFFEEPGQIVRAIMGNDAGIVGAAMLMRNED